MQMGDVQGIGNGVWESALRVYAAVRPATLGRAMHRINAELRAAAPEAVEFVSDPRDADLQILDVTESGSFEHLAHSRYVLILHCYTGVWESFWAPILRDAVLVVGAHDLSSVAAREGFAYHRTPYGVDGSVFYERKEPRDRIVLTTGWALEGEPIAECREAAMAVGGPAPTMIHVGAAFWKDGSVERHHDVKDDQLAALYSRARYVSALRRREGFELPGIEGLACGARPVCFDTPAYRDWYDGHAVFVREQPYAELVDALTDVFAQAPAPVTQAEREEVLRRFDWSVIGTDVWTQIRQRMQRAGSRSRRRARADVKEIPSSETLVDAHLAELFDRVRPQCVLDVGANEGQYGARLRAIGYRGWIVSFEPLAEAHDALERVARGDPRWRVFSFALGSTMETRGISVAEANQLSSFLARNAYSEQELGYLGNTVRVDAVEVRTLADCFDECTADLPAERAFLKIDTQGFDLEVLRGGGAALHRVAALQLEASVKPLYEGMPTYLETLAYVSSRGFDLTGFFPILYDSLQRVVEADCVFLNSRHPDAETWRVEGGGAMHRRRAEAEAAWPILKERLCDEVADAVPPGSRFVLCDNARLDLEAVEGRVAIPFLEREGGYWGQPPDDATAISELERLVAAGASCLVVAWPSFWWLDTYAGWSRYLEREWTCVSRSEAAMIFLPR